MCEINTVDQIEKFSKLIDQIGDWLYKAELGEMQKGNLAELTYSELHALKAVGEIDDAKLFEIADKTGVSRPSMSATIDKLEKKGFVFRDKDLTDRRAIIIRMTDKGQVANKEHEELHHRVAQKLLGNMNRSQQELLVKSFENILNKSLK